MLSQFRVSACTWFQPRMLSFGFAIVLACVHFILVSRFCVCMMLVVFSFTFVISQAFRAASDLPRVWFLVRLAFCNCVLHSYFSNQICSPLFSMSWLLMSELVWSRRIVACQLPKNTSATIKDFIAVDELNWFECSSYGSRIWSLRSDTWPNGACTHVGLKLLLVRTDGKSK